ncbi:MAG: ribonuclease D [Flavobacteriales bacterium]|nr:ribonuclease D [Flavobacteriales bacterium]
MSSAYTLITRTSELVGLMATLRKEPVLALDTEASSFHRYRERICLIQLSTRTKTWLIDPLTVDDMSALGKALAEPTTEWVIHDADYDLRMLKKMYGFRAVNVFDTMISVELLNEPELGLAANLKKHFGVELNKKYQKADWSKRPLSSEMLAYAAMDTTYLIGLRDILKKELEEKGRFSWAQEEFEALVHIPFAPVEEEPAYLRMKGAKALKPRQLAVLRELHAWRESVAEKMDRAPFMVLGNDVLLDVSKEPPADLAGLAARKGVGESILARSGTAIMKAIETGLSLPKEDWPRIPRPKRYERDDDYEDRLKRLKQKRDTIATARDLRQGIVCPNHVLMDIARLLPGDAKALRAISGLRDWQVREFGEELLKAL